MSRLYLIISFLFLASNLSAQNNLGKFLKFAEEQYNKGDYYYALEYYDKAMDLDSNSVDLLWKYAETLRAYKDYKRAELYYAKVYSRESAAIYPYSLLRLGLMQKMNGKYDEALATFKKAKKKYYKNKKGYLYLKSKREIASVVWAKSAIVDTAKVTFEPLPETVNTNNAEFGHSIINNELIFSSLRADSISEMEEVYSAEYSTSIYRSQLKGQTFDESEKIEELFFEKLNTGNGSLSLDGTRFYFSLCGDDGYNYTCKIMVAHYSDGTWSSIDSLGSIINEPGTNTTMPSIAKVDDKEYLFFSSNREDSKGGLDIYYSVIKNGNQYGKVSSIKTINSLDNEITPWWDEQLQRLYFSSSWHNSFGGYDVFYSSFKNSRFESAVNAGIPANSSANDLYYFSHHDTAYVSSNRIGVMYSKNPTCCSDIFTLIPPIVVKPPSPEETLADLNKRLPVTLYFHNDIPDPDSWDTMTVLNYIDSYNDYTAMIDRYKKEYAKGLSGNKSEEAKEDIESFFIEFVDKGVADLQLFRDLLLKELETGARINITVKGFASPLAKTDYNVNLTKRRISSLVNYLREYDNGVFANYIDGTASNGGKVIFSQVPFGEYIANQLTSDNPNDVQNSVYSRAAAKERKIEIQSVSYLDDQEDLPIKIVEPIIDLGEMKPDERKSATFEIRNKSDKPVTLENEIEHCDCLTVLVESTTIPANGSIKVEVEFNASGFSGHTVKKIIIPLIGFDQPIELFISTEIK